LFDEQRPLPLQSESELQYPHLPLEQRPYPAQSESELQLPANARPATKPAIPNANANTTNQRFSMPHYNDGERMKDHFWRLISELMKALPLGDAARQMVCARFAFDCAERALGACHQQGVPVATPMEYGIAQLRRYLAAPSEQTLHDLNEARLDLYGWKDVFHSEYAAKAVDVVVRNTEISWVACDVAKAADEAAVTLNGATRGTVNYRPQQIQWLCGHAERALVWPPSPPCPTPAEAWASLDALAHELAIDETWQQSVAKRQRRCAEIAVAEQEVWPDLEAAQERAARASKEPYEMGDYELIDYIEDIADDRSAAAFTKAGLAIYALPSAQDAIALTVEAISLAQSVRSAAFTAAGKRAIELADGQRSAEDIYAELCA
jgi:hypothetical protein